MNKWRKRALLAVLFLAVFAGTLAFVSWRMARGVPEWYERRKLDPREAEAAAGRAEQQLQRTLSWAQDRQAEALRRSQAVATRESQPSIEISFTQDELNGFFQKWDSTFGWSAGYSPYLSDPQVALRDGRLILAATTNDASAVVSFEFQPRLEDGKLYIPLTRVMAGRLPLPRPLWDRYRKQLESRVKERLPRWLRQADMTPQGANADALAAAMSELLLDILDDRPAPPILFLPYDMRNNPRSLPVNLIGVQIADKTLTLTIEPMDSGQRQQALSLIRRFSIHETVAE